MRKSEHTHKIIQWLEDELVPEWCSLYNDCLLQEKVPRTYGNRLKTGEDKDPAKSKPYRPICLLNVLWKIQEHRQETQETWTSTNFDSESNGKYVITIFFNISWCAFDNLWWPTKYSRNCTTSSAPSCCTRASAATVRIDTQSCNVLKKNLSRRIIKSCFQRPVCEPIFWDLLFEELLQRLAVNENISTAIAYGDDLMVWYRTDTREFITGKSSDVFNGHLCYKSIICVSVAYIWKPAIFHNFSQ